MQKIGLQMWSLRDITPTNMDKALSIAKKLGYDRVEFAGFFGKGAWEIRDMLRKYELELYGTHTPLDEFLNKPDETFHYHRAIGNKNVTVPSYNLATPEARKTFVERINSVAPRFAEEGIRMHYHNHSPEFLDYGGYELYDMLKKDTDLYFQIDIYHTFAAGFDPIEVIERYKERISCIHLRDGLGYKLDGKALGDGLAPVAACAKYAVEHGLNIVVENASATPSSESEAKRCIDYLRGIIG